MRREQPGRCFAGQILLPPAEVELHLFNGGGSYGNQSFFGAFAEDEQLFFCKIDIVFGQRHQFGNAQPAGIHQSKHCRQTPSGKRFFFFGGIKQPSDFFGGQKLRQRFFLSRRVYVGSGVGGNFPFGIKKLVKFPYGREFPCLRARLHFVFAESGHKFLGFVMGQGGIPLKALTQRKGWVGNLVHYLAWFRRYGTSEEVLQAYLEEHYKVPSSLDAGTVRRLMREAVVALAKILDVSVREDVGLQSPGWNGRFRIFEEEFPSCAIERRRFEDLVKSFEEEVRKVLRDSDGPFVSRRFLYWQPDDGSNERPELTLLFAVTKPVFDETLLLNLFPTKRSHGGASSAAASPRRSVAPERHAQRHGASR